MTPRRSACAGRSGLAEGVARYYFKLLAYKDEYEVARLYTEWRVRRPRSGASSKPAAGSGSIWRRCSSPSATRATGRLKKRAYGPWMLTAMRYLARLRRLRGTAFDPFGYSADRQTERALIGAYEATIAELLSGLSHDNHDLAVEIARIPEQIRGFGHIKERHLRAARQREAELLQAYRAAPARLSAAE